jgi:hypothetical protein
MTSTLQLQCLKKGRPVHFAPFATTAWLDWAALSRRRHRNEVKVITALAKTFVLRTNKFLSRDENLKFAHYPLCALAAGLSYAK